MRLSLEKEGNDLRTAWHENQRILKSLLALEPETRITIPDQNRDYPLPGFTLAELIATAHRHRPDLRIRETEIEYAIKSLVYEKSLRAADVTLGINYDRYGGVWKNFVGFGAGIDIPIFNRNKGKSGLPNTRSNKTSSCGNTTAG